MFVIPCKYQSQFSFIFECVDSIIKFHPEEKISIIDSCSDDKSYFNIIKEKPNVLLCDINNVNYEIGALWYAYKNFSGESHYILVHDSFIIKKSLSQFIEHNKSVAMMYFDEDINTSITHFPRFNYVGEAKAIMSKTSYVFNDKVNGLLGTMGIYSLDLIKRFDKKGLINAFVPKNKFDSQMGERIIGMCAAQEGVNFQFNNIEGNYMQRVNDTIGDNLEFFTKRFPIRK